MMSLVWVSALVNDRLWEKNHSLVTKLSAGQTLIRIAFTWGFNGYTDTNASLRDTWRTSMAFGFVTTVGDGTEVPPSAQPPASNVAPPTQRWLWWEARSPVLVGDPDQADRFVFRSSEPSQTDNSEGMVLAANIPIGQTLNLWASWWPTGTWDANGQAFLWYAARVAVKVP